MTTIVTITTTEGGADPAGRPTPTADAGTAPTPAPAAPPPASPAEPPAAPADQPKEAPAAKAPDEAKPEDAGVKKGKRTPLLILTAVVVVVAIAGLLYYLHERHFEETDDAFIEGHVTAISPRIAARVLEVHFNDNDDVKQGQLLVVFDPRDLAAALERAQAQLAQAQAQVLQAEGQAAQAKAQLAQAEAQSTQRKAEVELARINFARNRSLSQRDLRAIAQQEVDSTKAILDGDAAALAAALANIEAATAAGEAAHAAIVSAQANATAALASVHNAELQLSHTHLFAAVAGRIAGKRVEPGDYVEAATQLCSLVQPDYWITANFKETQLRQMRVGQTVAVNVDAYPDRTLKARVQSFQPGTGARFSLLPTENATGNYVKVIERVPVKLVFDEPLEVLRRLAPGMSVEPSVDLRTSGADQP
jgi:membrane fusion protein (multidrug efflux system)